MSALLKHIRDRVEVLRPSRLSVRPYLLSPAVDRWVLASLLQKAIRRGRPDVALAVALKLLDIDPSRLWRRLMTVALEDIGVGDLDVTLDLAAASGLPAARKLFGGSQACLEILVPLACSATKDRTGDHLASLVRWEGVGDEGQEAGTGPRTEPGSMEPPSGAFWGDHARAISMLAAAWGRGRLNLAEALRYFARQEAPGALLEAASGYARRCGDPLFLYALAGWAIRARHPAEQLALARQGLAGADLGGLPDYGLDPLRTRLGRRAVQLWLRSYLEKLPFEPGQIAAGLWNVEAALCNQTLYWSAGGEIQAKAYEADLLAHGLPVDRHAALQAWIGQERPVLFAARQMVWQSHLRTPIGITARQGGSDISASTEREGPASAHRSKPDPLVSAFHDTERSHAQS